MTDRLLVLPAGVLGVWCDVRALEDYPEPLRQRRGPAPRGTVAFRGVVQTWIARGARCDSATLANLRRARKQILKFNRVAEALGARRLRTAGRLRQSKDADQPAAVRKPRVERAKDARLPGQGVEYAPLGAEAAVPEAGPVGDLMKKDGVAPHDGGVVRLPEDGHGSVADTNGIEHGPLHGPQTRTTASAAQPNAAGSAACPVVGGAVAVDMNDHGTSPVDASVPQDDFMAALAAVFG